MYQIYTKLILFLVVFGVLSSGMLIRKHDEDSTPGAGSLTAAFTATQIQGSTCVAPCAVHYDATATNDTDYTREFHTHHFKVDCGIAAAGKTPGTWGPTGYSTDIDIGAIGGCWYTEPGTYTQTLTVTAPDGETDTDTETVTVTDPATEFAGAGEAVCIADGATPTAGDVDGCPAHATVFLDLDSFTDLEDALDGGSAEIDNVGSGAKRAIYLRGGDTFPMGTVLALYRGNTNPGLITSYGTGCAIISNASGFVFSAGHGWTIDNICYSPSTNTVTGFLQRPTNTPITGMTLSRIDASGTLAGLVDGNTGGADGNRNDLWAIIATTYDKTATTTGGESSLIMINRAERLLAFGNDWDINNLAANSFGYRFNGLARSAIKNNRHEGSGSTGNERNPIQIRVDDVNPSEFNIVADNILGTAASNAIRACPDDECTLCPASTCTAGTCAGGSQVGVECGTVDNENLIIERNFVYVDNEVAFLGSGLSNVFQLQAGDVTVRNNVVVATGAPDASLTFVTRPESSWGTENKDNIHVFNNTFHGVNTRTGSDTYITGCATGIGCEARGNLFHLPNKSSSETLVAAEYTASDNGRDRQASGDNYTGSPFFGADLACDATATISAQASASAAEFQLCATPITGGEDPIDSGFAGAVLDEFDRDLRSGTISKGAWEN